MSTVSTKTFPYHFNWAACKFGEVFIAVDLDVYTVLKCEQKNSCMKEISFFVNMKYRSYNYKNLKMKKIKKCHAIK